MHIKVLPNLLYTVYNPFRND